jgi:hypothetical protein
VKWRRTRSRAWTPRFRTSARSDARRSELLPEGLDDRVAGSQGNGDAAVLRDELRRPAVVDDDRHEADRHRLEDGAAAEFADAREGEHLGLREASLELLVGHPALEPDAVLALLAGDERTERVHLRPSPITSTRIFFSRTSGAAASGACPRP